MKFDKLCDIILGEARAEKFAKLVLGNQTPTFAKEDIMRDPADPSKGTMMYLAGKDEKRRGWEAGSEQSVRRQLRRLNWVARNVIKKMTGREEGLSVEKVHELISNLLERYQTVVLSQKVDKANTGYETRVIGNLLLPPAGRNSRGKSVLIVPGMDPNATAADATKPVAVSSRQRRTGKVIKLAPVTADELFRKWEDVSEFFEQLLDTDLLDTIRNIIETGGETPEPEEDEEEEQPAPATAPDQSAAVESPVGEAIEGEEPLPPPVELPQDELEAGMVSGEEAPDVGVTRSVTLRDILKHPRIKGVFDPRAVKIAVKGMIKGGELEFEPNGGLVFSGQQVTGSRLAPGEVDIEVEPEELELTAAKFGGEELPPSSATPSEEDEEEIEPGIPAEKPTWYPEVEKGEEEEEEEGEEEDDLPEENKDEEAKKDEWWK